MNTKPLVCLVTLKITPSPFVLHKKTPSDFVRKRGRRKKEGERRRRRRRRVVWCCVVWCNDEKKRGWCGESVCGCVFEPLPVKGGKGGL